MIYPKKGAQSEVSGAQQSGGASQNRKFLSNAQREELKRTIAERLSKKYGVKYTDLIKDEVSAFMAQQKNITAGALEQLENNIKNATQGRNGGANNNGARDDKDDDEKSVKSGLSKMSGASNFDAVDKYTRKNVAAEADAARATVSSAKGGASAAEGAHSDDALKNRKLQTLNVRKPENDLDFLDEENEWAAIYKYNRYLFEKEEALKKQRQAEQKLKMRDELDRQIAEKDEKKRREKEELEKFAQNQQLQMQRYDDREKNKQNSIQELRLAEKDARLRQIKENKYRRRHESKQEKALDAFLMQKVREELEAEQKYLEYKREHQKQVMEKLLLENEERRTQARQDAEAERQENIRLMNAYAKLIEDQERERERTLQERDRKMKEFQTKALEVVVQENEDKVAQMERRRDKYEARHEKKLQQEEELRKQREQQQKQDMKAYLLKQAEERQVRRAQDRAAYNEQAEIWRRDNEKFSDFERTKTQQKKELMKEYFNSLKTQINDNAASKKLSLARMNENEALLNRHLLDELDSLRGE